MMPEGEKKTGGLEPDGHGDASRSGTDETGSPDETYHKEYPVKLLHNKTGKERCPDSAATGYSSTKTSIMDCRKNNISSAIICEPILKVG